MDKIVIHPSQTAQWYSLINEAEVKCSLQLGEELESYLVFLLMRFVNRPELAVSIIALEFLNGMQLSGNRKKLHLQEVGDKCLLFAGLFPQLAKKRNVHDNYFTEVGQNAYFFLSEISLSQSAKLYESAGRKFSWMRDVLKAISPNMHSWTPNYSELFSKPMSFPGFEKKSIH